MADGFSADVSDLNSVAADFGRASGQIGSRASRIVRKTAQDIAATAQQFVPVDTGATKGSIGADIEGDGRFASMSAEIGPTTEYAPHLEYGTATAAPHAFMGPALDRHAPAFVEAIEQIAGDL